MINNYSRNHNLPTRRYCGYHKKRERQKERERFNKYFAPVIEECIRNIFPSKEDWKRNLLIINKVINLNVQLIQISLDNIA